MYIVRLLPVGRKKQGSSESDPARFGNSRPCVRCLQALEVAGVRRVVYTTGAHAEDGGVGVESHLVADLIEVARAAGGHSSRGDAAAAGAAAGGAAAGGAAAAGAAAGIAAACCAVAGGGVSSHPASPPHAACE